MSFWAVEVSPSKEYTTAPPFDLHITQAVLPASAVDKSGRSVIQCAVDGKTFSIGALKLDHTDSIHLDLVFEEGTDVTFTVTGKNPVHLTGYFIAGGEEDDDLEGLEGLDDDEMEGLEEDDFDEDDEEGDEEAADLATAKALQENLKRKQLPANGNAAKKAKHEPAAEAPKQPQQPKQQSTPKQVQQPQQTPKQPQPQKGQQNSGGKKPQQNSPSAGDKKQHAGKQKK